MKKYLLAILIVTLTKTFVSSQVIHTQWKMSTKKISECEYDLIFTVNIDKNWHISSISKIKGAEGEVFPTVLSFKPNKGYTLIGNLTETKPKAVYDETIEKTVLLHYNKVVFTQRIRLNAGSKIKVIGSYQYQVCDDSKCDSPPKNEFSFDLQGTQSCSK